MRFLGALRVLEDLGHILPGVLGPYGLYEFGDLQHPWKCMRVNFWLQGFVASSMILTLG